MLTRLDKFVLHLQQNLGADGGLDLSEARDGIFGVGYRLVLQPVALMR